MKINKKTNRLVTKKHDALPETSCFSGFCSHHKPQKIITARIKTLFFLLFLFVCLALIKEFLFAQPLPSLEIIYPTLVHDIAPPQSARTYLPRYFQYLYTFGIFIAGLVALAAFLWGGFRYVTSAGNPGAMSDAKEQIFSGVLGLVIILGTYIFLNELNPQLTQFRLPQVEPVRRGIVLYNQENCARLGDLAGLPEFDPDLDPSVSYRVIESTSTNLRDPTKPDRSFRAASFYTFHSGAELSVFFYRNNNCEGTPENADLGHFGKMKPNTCVAMNPVPDTKCVKMIWRLPGVWLFGYPWGNPLEPGRDFTKTGLSVDNPFEHLQSSQESLPREIDNRVHSIGLVNEVEKNISYGVILHNLDGGFNKNKGWALVFLPDSNPERDITVYNLGGDARSASSVTIFTIPKKTKAGGEEFVVCRNPRCDEEWRAGKHVYPQLRIGWDEGKKGVMPLGTASNLGCEGGRSVNSRGDQTRAIGSPEGWLREVTCNDKGGQEKMIGSVGLLFGGRDSWNDEDGTRLEDMKIIQNRSAGVSAVYLPRSPQYIVLLYDRLHSGGDLISRSATNNRSSAAVTIGNIADLTAIRWNDRTAAIVVIRIDAFY